MNCAHCQGVEKQFDKGVAERALREYRSHGPGKTTRLLIEALKAAGIEDLTLLDIGGGFPAGAFLGRHAVAAVVAVVEVFTTAVIATIVVTVLAMVVAVVGVVGGGGSGGH